MSNPSTENIRNIAVVAHSNAGKTSLVEAMLESAGAIKRLGTVEEGNTVTDYEPEEISRKITISSSMAFCDYSGHRINILDTPGFNNLLEDTRGAMRAADGAVFIASAQGGVKGEAEKLWKYADDFGIPRLVFVNKMDRDPADFFSACEAFQQTFGIETIPMVTPIGAGETFSGLVDLLCMKAYTFKDRQLKEIPIPEEVQGQVSICRKRIVEKVAELDDALLERYLEGGELTQEEIVSGVRQGSVTGKFIPMLCGSATKNIGVKLLMDTVIHCLASPLDMAQMRPAKGKNPKDNSEVTRKPLESEHFSAYVFKTIADPFAGKLSMFKVESGVLSADSSVYNPTTDTKERIGQVFYMMGKQQVSAQKLGPGEIGVVAKLKNTNTGNTLCEEAHQIVYPMVEFEEPMISYAIEAKNKGEEDKISIGLHRILDEDPTLRFSRDEEAKDMIIAGMGQIHLEIALEKLKRKFGVEVVMKTPKIPYRETIRAKTTAQGRYKKQSGGKGQYGDCWIEVEPLPRGSGYEFVDKVVGGSIPRNYIPAVDKGVQEAMKRGLYAGYHMVDMRVSVYDGSYHPVDSSEMAFKIAGSLAIKKAMETAKPVVLEPVMKVEISIPDEYLGAVIGDLNGRRGKVQGMEQVEGSTKQKVVAVVPMAEMLTYANQLISMTAGRGMYHMAFSHYEDLPAHLTQKLLEERKHEEEE